MDFLAALVPFMAGLLKIAPELKESAEKLAKALEFHPNEEIRPGAEHVKQAIENAEQFDRVMPPQE